MKASDDLFQLIKSLSKSEKGYFKKFASLHIMGEKNNYVRLFDTIDKQRIFNEQEIISKLKKEKFIQHFAVVKNYLYNLLLKSLESFHDSINAELNNHLIHIEILMGKGLYDSCEKIISIAKKKAEVNQKPLHLIQILQFEIFLVSRQKYENKTEQDLLKIFDQISKAKKDYDNVFQYNQIFSSISILTAKYGGQKVQGNPELKQIVENPLFQKEEHATSRESLRLFYSANYNYLNSQGKHKDAFKFAIKISDLLEKIPEMKNDPFSYHFNTLSAMVATQLYLGDYSGAEISLNKLKTLKINSEFLKYRLFYLTSKYELFICVEFNYGDGLTLVRKIERMLSLEQGNNIANKIDRRIIYVQFITILVVFKKFEDASKYINKLLYEVTLRSEMRTFAKIMNHIIHIELENKEYLESIVRSTYRYLKKENQYYEFEKIWITFIKNKLISSGPKQKLIGDYLWLKDKIIEITNKASHGSIAKYFEFIPWIDSKIENRPLIEIIKEKQIQKRLL